MYSQRLLKIFGGAGIKIGDRIRVTRGGRIYEGLLMPRPGAGSPDCIILKLDSGYNVGLAYETGANLTKSATAEPKAVEREAKYELGKGSHRDAFNFDSSKPPVSFITTGGTISSKVDYRTGGVTALVEPKELLHLAPEMSKFVNVRTFASPFTRMSENMGFDDYAALASAVFKAMKKDEGVIVTHGTDTLHYTAAALSFAIRDPAKPVVLTGSQRSSDRGSTDASMNLLCSAIAAASDMAEVGVCMHGTSDDAYALFNRGTKVRKLHASRRDAFRPVNALPLARVYPDGKIERLSPYRKRGEGVTRLDAEFYPKVALLKAYPGCKPDIVDYYVSKGYKGIVVEALGLGQVPTETGRSWLNAIRKAIDGGVTVVFAPQTIYGRLNPYVYAEARLAHDAGVVYAEDMLPEVAYVKLAWVLGHTKIAERVREMFLTNIAGEMSSRTTPETFLY
ncbi:MAG: Glu-tRNA(Gln) amidotransferase subunit GatD [Candidatus Aenigmatarchaeota archaeon]|nr:MAG: Glu-tRNA(Gln) amidotransferase subunit GatD [Candidatus Aenigmarchaeota archaeon]